ncbi:hypothetical protein AWB70_02098 [Caballeronia cordobensis]|uniref:Uncharacterized protein n=1 Tax=Caballeronia cordobensis TaxID=1353886 RepID=A0A158GL67_CABCO|nr:hypothetical protein AWB70_02098 [Caballeronia cordobensis]
MLIPPATTMTAKMNTAVCRLIAVNAQTAMTASMRLCPRRVPKKTKMARAV